MISTCCKTEIQDRVIPFGKAGRITVYACECEATKLVLEYANSKYEAGDSEAPELS